MKNKICVLIHSFYNDVEILNEIFEAFNHLNENILFLINTSLDSNIPLLDNFNYRKNTIIIRTPNKGKDIGGKLALLDLMIRLNIESDYIIFLHDKKSPHTTLGKVWRQKLFRIIDKGKIEVILFHFETNPSIGIIASNEFINNEFNHATNNFECTSNHLIKEVLNELNLNPINYDFIGGTMFWVRYSSIIPFFRIHPPLKIRAKLENGNVLDHDIGSYTHTWERILSWISTSQGNKIKGI